jgi:hypothetical protein
MRRLSRRRPGRRLDNPLPTRVLANAPGGKPDPPHSTLVKDHREKSFSMRSPAMTVRRSMSVSMREMIPDNGAQGKHPEIVQIRGFSPAVRAVTTR